MAEHKINSKEVLGILGSLNSISKKTQDPDALGLLESLEKYIHAKFPERLEIEQEYCCNVFENRVEGGLIKEIRGRWELQGTWSLNYCFNCGQKPKPPIKS